MSGKPNNFIKIQIDQDGVVLNMINDLYCQRMAEKVDPFGTCLLVLKENTRISPIKSKCGMFFPMEMQTKGRGDQEMYVSSQPEIVEWAKWN